MIYYISMKSRMKIAFINIVSQSIHQPLQKIIHRQLAAENTMLTSEGHIKLTEFGMCKKVSRIKLTVLRIYRLYGSTSLVLCS